MHKQVQVYWEGLDNSMPKIPTFEARGRITAEPAGVQTGIQVSPTASTAAALIPGLNELSNYAIKKRDTAEKVESAKKVFEIKGELDKYLQAEKENINDEDAINNFKTKYNNYVNQQLGTITNSRVKKRIQQNLDLELSEYIYNIKSNSYKALEKDSLLNINNELNSLSGKYATTDNSILKVKYKTQAKDKIREFAQDFGLPENVLNKKLEAVDRDFLLADINQLVGLDNGKEQIKNLDNSLNGTKFLNDDEFGKGVYNSYLNKISEITIKGDPNSDYDRAIELIDELKTFQRSNGYEVKTGEISLKIDELEEKILTERVTHENLLEQTKNGLDLTQYADEQKKGVGAAFYNSLDPTMSKASSKDLATEATQEYDERFDAYIKANPDASPFEKKQYARDLKLLLIDKYQDANIEQVSTFSLQQNKFNVVRTENEIVNSFKNYQTDPEQPNILKTLAKLNGYVDDKKNPDVIAFFNDYIEILKSRKKD